jgi:hypothetical protein
VAFYSESCCLSNSMITEGATPAYSTPGPTNRSTQDQVNLPSPDYAIALLGRLGELYECRLADLLIDCSDHRSRDSMHQISLDLSRVASGTTAAPELATIERDDFQHDPGLVERLDTADVNELAVVTAAWSRKFGDQVDRRSVLLKLSVALTLAATMPTSELQAATREPGSDAESSDLTGIWRSDYSYISSGRGAEFNDSHFVVLRQKGQQLSVASLPHTSGSELSLSLTLRAMSLTGTWEEKTSASGYYKGAIYRGALQLLVSPSGSSMTGKWIGFGKNFAINTGDWSLTLETRSTSASALRRYELAL